MSTYSDLKDDISSFLEEEEPNFVSKVPTFIRLAEARLNREVYNFALRRKISGSIAAGNYTIPRPDDLVQVEFLSVMDGNDEIIIQRKRPEYLVEFLPDRSETGFPKYYAVEVPETFRIAPAVENMTTYNLVYKRRLPALSDTNQSNWFTTHAYDLILYASLLEGARFLLDDRQNSATALYEPRYREALMNVNREDDQADRDGYSEETISTVNKPDVRSQS